MMPPQMSFIDETNTDNLVLYLASCLRGIWPENAGVDEPDAEVTGYRIKVAGIGRERSSAAKRLYDFASHANSNRSGFRDECHLQFASFEMRPIFRDGVSTRKGISDLFCPILFCSDESIYGNSTVLRKCMSLVLIYYYFSIPTFLECNVISGQVRFTQ